MTRLELVIKTMDECRIPGTRPTALDNTNTREVQLFTGWCDQAWLEIQGVHDNWNFMQGEFSFQTQAAKSTYTKAEVGLTDHRYWLTDTFRCYRTAVGKADDMWLVEWDYPVFRDTYQFGQQVDSRPFVFTTRPRDSALIFGPQPDDIYTVYGEYRKTPSVLANDSASPSIPDHLHMIIVYKAMIFYGYEQSAPEVIARGEVGFAKLMTMLSREELPDVTFGEPLA